jgi:hypothetical protein
MANGGLWNTFILVGRLRTFLSLLASATPHLCLGFGPLVSSIDLASEPVTAAAVRPDIRHRLFERCSTCSQSVWRIEAPAMGWTDLGRADRVLAIRSELSLTPPSSAPEIRLAAS